MTLVDQILYIDAEAIVIAKPAGLPVDAPRRGGDSIARRIGELSCGFQRPPTPMHRLDQDTSGCLLFARTAKARAAFQQAFEAGLVEKFYLAVVDGALNQPSGVIELPLKKVSSRERGWRMVSDPAGQVAVTEWTLLHTNGAHSLVQFHPRTGRTHQIRVHALEGLGAAIVGDPVYGDGSGPMLLHASRIIVPRATKPPIDVTAPLPEHFGEWRDAA